MIPRRRHQNSNRASVSRECPQHRQYVRGYECANPKCETPDAKIECAHRRTGTDCGMGLKPSDRHTLPLCANCHRRQHEIGEAAFEKETGLNMRAVSDALARKSPHWPILKEMP